MLNKARTTAVMRAAAATSRTPSAQRLLPHATQHLQGSVRFISASRPTLFASPFDDSTSRLHETPVNIVRVFVPHLLA